MLRIQATIGLTTYYFASEALDYANRYWEPRISNAFQISREFNSADKSGNKIRSVDISLDNRDGFFNSIYTTSGLVNGKFVLYFNEGDNVVKTFTGRVNKINSFGDDISLTLREVGYEYLTRKFPDAQIAYDYYSASGINDSWNAIPIHLGTVNRYPCPWVNLFESHFIIGSGPIHSVKKIYFDKTVVYDSSTGKNGYKPTPESPEIKFRIFKGARAGYTDIVEGVESSYPGFAYIQLYKIVNSVEEPADPVNPDGEAVQIYVDIEGLQNEAGNGPERNPAQILYQFFTKPYTAEEGYGLAISPDDLDFSAAITECGIQGFKIDGSIDNTTDFGEWIDEILRCCRGQLYETGGKISVRIDAAAASPTIHFDETGEIGYNCIVDTWTEPERDAQTNRVRLSYSWNFENSNFNKKPSYNQESPLGDTHLQNATHAARIQKWNTETLEYKLIKDDTTAHKLAQYYLNNIVKQLITTSLTTEVDIPNTVDAGTVIKVTSPKYGWSEKQFRITSISRSEENTEIQFKEYDASIFTFYDPGTGAETSDNQYSVYNIPNKPEMSSLAVVNELLADGSTQTRVNVTFVKPTENAQFIALYYKLSSEPESSFRILETTTDATQMSAIWKGIETGVYNFRLAAISSVGIYSDISVAAGDKHYYGQPNAEATVTMTGDTIAPGTPTITATNPVMGGVSMYIDISGGIPSDFSHFEIYRQIGSGTIDLLDSNYSGQLFTDNDRSAGYLPRTYYAKAFDKTGNSSVLSAASGSVVPLQVKDEDITNQPIIGKCFKTACVVGVGNPGVVFDSAGIIGYNATTKSFCLDAVTGNVSMSGTITALAGNIGGWCIDSCNLTKVGATRTVQLNSVVGSIQTFVNANPEIGEWHGQIYNNGIQTGRYGFAVTRGANNYIFRADTDVNGDNECSQIAGWDFNHYRLAKAVGSTGMISIDSSIASFFLFPDNTGNHRISMGRCLYVSSGYISVDNGIAITGANNTNIFQAWKWDSVVCANIAGWDFNNGCLYANNIILNSTGSIQTADFVTGNKGWKIDCNGNAELNNICARGAIRTAVFIKDQISVVGGCALIRPATTFAIDNLIPAFGMNFYVTDVSQFAINDVVRVKDGSNDYWGQVVSCTPTYLGVNPLSGVYGWTATKGQAIVNYGPANSGGIMLNGQAPYIDLYTHDGAPWNGTNSRVRIGNLNGWGSDFTTGDYGWVAGCPTGQRAFYTPRTGLCVVGNISSCSGDIGGWTLTSDGFTKTHGNGGMCILPSYGAIYTWSCDSYTMLGRMYWNGSWGQNAYGISIVATSNGALSAGMGVSTTGNTTLPDGSVSLQGNSFFWAGCATEHVKYVNGKLTVRGDLEVVGNGNILPDPDFRGVQYNSDYFDVGATVIGEYIGVIAGSAAVYTAYRGEWRANQYARPNSNSIWLYAIGSGYGGFVSKNYIPVKGGAQYTLSTYVAKHSGYANACVYLGMYYYDSNFTFICYDYPTLAGYSLDAVTPTRFSGVKTMPANTAYVKLIAYNYQPGGASYVYFSGLQLEEGATLTSWKCNQGGTITANSIKSGALQSLNWNGSTVGSCINMDNGTFNFGGGNLTFDGSTLTTKGTVCANDGKIGCFCISNGLCYNYQYSSAYRGCTIFDDGCIFLGLIACGGMGGNSCSILINRSLICILNNYGDTTEFESSLFTKNCFIMHHCSTGVGSGYCGIRLCGDGCFEIWNCRVGAWSIGINSNCIYFNTGICGLTLTEFGFTVVYDGIPQTLLNSSCSGSSASTARFMTEMAAASCYAMCTNGKIKASTFEGYLNGYSDYTLCLSYFDTRCTNINPFCYTGVTWHFKVNGCDGLTDGGTYHRVLNLTGWGDSSGGHAHQIGFTDNINLWFRSHDGSSWLSWYKVALNARQIYGCSAACDAICGYAATANAVVGCSTNYGVFGCVSGSYGIHGFATQYHGVNGYAGTAYAVSGNGSYYNTSTRTLKQGFEDVDVLPGLRSMCIQKWTWADANQRGFDEFIAPVAEDVAAVFGLTFKDDGYYTLDGIALKAAQEIDQNVQVHDSCIEFLKEKNSSLESRVEQMSLKLKMIEERLGIN